MSGNAARRKVRIAGKNCLYYGNEMQILVIGVWPVVLTFKLDANGKIIATVTTSESRFSGMPGAPAEWHELQHRAVTIDHQMGRDLQVANFCEVGMRVPVETIGKEFPDVRPTEFSRRQADAMNEDKPGFDAGRTVVLIRRWALDGGSQQADAGTDGIVQGLRVSQLEISGCADALIWSFQWVLDVNAFAAGNVKPPHKRDSMPRPRLFSTVSLSPDTNIVLDDVEARYIGRVLRLRPGAELIVFDGRGGEYAATLDMVTKQKLNLAIGHRRDRDTESPLRIRLVQGVSRGDKMDVVVQKATELGVHRISPVLADFSVVKFDAERATRRREHWQKVARSACEQCLRNFVPIIDTPQSLLDWFGDNADAENIQLILQPDAVHSMPEIEMRGYELTILVGPEGGFSQVELERAKAAGLQAVKLGPRVMRTETAAIAALGVAQSAWGDY